jgi:hypothetical protein
MASKQRVGSSSLPGRAIALELNKLQEAVFTPLHCEASRRSGTSKYKSEFVFAQFLQFFAETAACFSHRNMTCHENVTRVLASIFFSKSIVDTLS